MNLLVRQTERADGRLDGVASPSFYDATEKHIGECGGLCSLRTFASAIVSNRVLRFRLAVSEFLVIQSIVLQHETRVGTEVNEDARIRLCVSFYCVPSKKMCSAITSSDSSFTRDNCRELTLYALHEEYYSKRKRSGVLMRTSSRDNLCKAPRRFSRFFQYTFVVEAIFCKVKSIGDEISLRIKI